MGAKRILVVAAIAALAGCGRVAELQPAPGDNLPVKPLMARTTPTARDLLAAPITTRPQRVDELVTRSQPRSADPFDLPPPTGGAAPSLPSGPAPGTVTSNSTSITPGD